jgi:putative transposase
MMGEIDRKYLETPFYGRAKMTEHLTRLGHKISEGRVGRMMRRMGIRAIMPRFNSSKRNPAHKVYPYLLKGSAITKINQVWVADITFVRLKKGYMYLVAIIDLYSRRVMSWRLSNTMDTAFCVEALKESIEEVQPEIFNTDQGSQFTSEAFTKVLLAQGIQISMDGKGRAIDNVFIERVWRSVKYECLYLRQFETVSELRSALRDYFEFYNTRRYHQSLNYQTPEEVYGGQEPAETNNSPRCGNVENPLGLRTVPQLL